MGKDFTPVFKAVVSAGVLAAAAYVSGGLLAAPIAGAMGGVDSAVAAGGAGAGEFGAGAAGLADAGGVAAGVGEGAGLVGGTAAAADAAGELVTAGAGAGSQAGGFSGTLLTAKNVQMGLSALSLVNSVASGMQANAATEEAMAQQQALYNAQVAATKKQQAEETATLLTATRKRAAGASNIKTSGQGVLGTAPVTKKVLLGA